MEINNRIVCFVIGGLLCGALSWPLRAEDPVESVQKAAGEWAKVRAETIRVESEWEWQKVLMESTRDALLARVLQLDAKRAELEAKTMGERRDTAELTARRQAMAGAAADAAKHLLALDEKLVRLRAWLPPRLSLALELPYRSLAAPGLPLGERMQHSMTILNRCQHFNRTIASGEETLAVPGGEAKLLEVVYWGLSHGYALDRAAGTAYLGAPGANGWAWSPAPELAKAVARLIAVSQDKAQPEFVEMALRISDPAALQLQP